MVRSLVKLVPLLCCATLLSGAAAPTTHALAQPEPEIPQMSVLPNGLQVVTLQRPRSPASALDLEIRAGSRYEDAGTDSAAQLLQRMYLRGTAARPTRDAVLSPILARGGAFDAEADWETLRFTATMGRDDLAVALDVLGDVVLNSLFDADMVERERRALLKDLREIQDDGNSLAFDLFERQMFRDHPMAHLPAGSETGAQSLTRDALLGFRDRQAHAGNAAIAIVSPFAHADVVAGVAAALGAWPGGQPTGPGDPLAPPGAGEQLTATAGESQAQVVVGVPTMDVRSADRYVLQLLQQGMNGFGGRLFQKVRQERGLAYTTYAGADFTTLAGVLYFYAGTPPEAADQVADLLRAELLRLRDEPFTAAELERARGGSIGSY
ncbi:MAG: insulinase family protein [Chloroflexi bacterium]|nr:insulinase family protein [Chloroflexota bacterium]